jgi:hypothetical protein
MYLEQCRWLKLLKPLYNGEASYVNIMPDGKTCPGSKLVHLILSKKHNINKTCQLKPEKSE